MRRLGELKEQAVILRYEAQKDLIVKPMALFNFISFIYRLAPVTDKYETTTLRTPYIIYKYFCV